MVCSISDPASAGACTGAAWSGAFPATSFDAAGANLVAGSRAGVVLVETATVIILQDWMPQTAFRGEISTLLSEPAIE
jgi:hypothetical protein